MYADLEEGLPSPDLDSFAWPSSESDVEEKVKPKPLVIVQSSNTDRHILVRNCASCYTLVISLGLIGIVRTGGWDWK